VNKNIKHDIKILMSRKELQFKAI